MGLGLAIAQAVSRWLPTTVARVRALVLSCGICGGQSGAAAGFLQVLRFPVPIFIPQIAPESPSSIIWGWYNRSIVSAVPNGLSLAPLIIITIIIIIIIIIIYCTLTQLVTTLHKPLYDTLCLLYSVIFDFNLKRLLQVNQPASDTRYMASAWIQQKTQFSLL
jgi:hypothetical protein